MNQIPSLQAIEREQARRSLIDFTEYTFPGYSRNWHHELIAEWLDDVARFERDRVIITTPPRRGKSELVSRRFPAYALGRWPDAEIIACSYGADLARSMSRDVQRIIMSEPYRELFPETTLNADHVVHDADKKYKRTADEFEIVGHTGAYLCRGVGGGITGHGANYIIVDDPIKNREQANSQTFRDKLWNWYNDDLVTRLETPGAIVVMLTRWHNDDLIGRLLERKPEKWDVLHLPEINEGKPDVCGDPRDYDPRDEGEALWPGWYLAQGEQVDPDSETPEHVTQESLGGTQDPDEDTTPGDSEVTFIDYSVLEDRAEQAHDERPARTRLSLYQGRPPSEDGDMFKREWFQRYSAPPHKIACDEKIISVDCTFKDADTSDYVVLQVWGKRDARKFLLDQKRAKMGITDTRDALKDLSAKWPDAHVKLIETKANGDALINLLKGKVPGLIGFDPGNAGKEERAQVAAWEFEARDVFLPPAEHAPWIGDYIEELASFPNAPNDDQVDATSQVMIRWQSKSQNPKKSMARILGQ